MEFNPFNRDPRTVAVDDLHSLRAVSEGWFIEYKREVPAADNIAKSVSALANSRGGWLFYGVSAPSASIGKPDGFPGVLTGDVSVLQRRITDAVAAHVDPTPFFEVIPLDGPNTDVGLPDGRSVIAIRVPVGRRAPYVHSSGRVYIRVGDKSDPMPEIDRNRLQHLFERTERTTKRLRALLSEPSIEFADQPVLQVVLSPDRWNDRQREHRLTLAQFAEAMWEAAPPPATAQDDYTEHVLKLNLTMPFPRVHSTVDQLVARQASNGMLSTTLRLHQNGTVVIRAPFSWCAPATLGDVKAFVNGYQQAESFVERWKEDGFSSVRILDISSVYPVLVGTWRKVHKVLSASAIINDGEPLAVQVWIHNVAPAVCFIDTAAFKAHIAAYGLPVIADRKIAIPGPALDDVLEFAFEPSNHAGAFANAAVVMFHITTAVGLASSELTMEEEALGGHVTDWIELAERVMRVQEKRRRARLSSQ